MLCCVCQRQEPSFASSLEPELQGPGLERSWSLMQQALQERHQLIEQEIANMERLQRLADKVTQLPTLTDTDPQLDRPVPNIIKI